MFPPNYSRAFLGSTYIRGAEYVERISVSLPVKFQYEIYKTKRYKFFIDGGPLISFYFPVRNQLIGRTYLLDGSTGYSEIRAYEINRDFPYNKRINFIGTSTPNIEWQFDIEVARKFKRRGAVLAGIITHIGTTKLERANFVIWPELPQYRSRGHYSLNRSYVGFYLGYRFGRNSFNTKK